MPARFKSDSMTLQKHPSAPTAPDSGEVALYVKQDGKLYSRDSSNTETPVGGSGAMSLPLPTLRNFWIVRAANTIPESIGIANPTTTVATEANDVDSTYINYSVAAAVNTVGGFITPTPNLVRRQYSPTLEMIVRTSGDVSSIRLWLGLVSTAAGVTITDALPAATAGCLFRFSTNVPDGGWVGVCGNGTTQSVTSTLAPITPNTRYLLRLRIQETPTPTAYFSVNNGPETALTTNLPSDVTELGFQVRLANTIAAIRDMRFSRAVCTFD